VQIEQALERRAIAKPLADLFKARVNSRITW
jgi:hypothetical protein